MQPDPPDRAIAALQLIAAEGFDVIVVGAVARELVFDRKLGDRPHRATRDVDVAVRTEDWDRYEDLATKLSAVLGFRRVETDGLKFVHEDGTELDVLPYGAVLDQDERLRWPGDATRTMSMRAFKDLDERAVTTEYGRLAVRVPTLSDLVAQKLVELSRRGAATRRRTSRISPSSCRERRPYSLRASTTTSRPRPSSAWTTRTWGRTGSVARTHAPSDPTAPRTWHRSSSAAS